MFLFLLFPESLERKAYVTLRSPASVLAKSQSRGDCIFTPDYVAKRRTPARPPLDSAIVRPDRIANIRRQLASKENVARLTPLRALIRRPPLGLSFVDQTVIYATVAQMANSSDPNKVQPVDQQQERWLAEAAFFDSEEYSEGLIPEITVQRYLDLKKPWLPAEYPLSCLGNIEGKRILEIGCGDGSNAILLGLKGARVRGIDISPRAIEIANKRAVLHGIADRVHFVCTPLELYAESEKEPFDIICGWAVLHHVLPVLDSVLVALKKLAFERTIFLFTEPVSMWQWLRNVRLMLPIAVHGTPDERPLNSADMAIILRHLPNLRMRYFGFALRLLMRLLPRNYETSSGLVRFCYDSAGRLDNLLLQLLGIRGLASSVTLHGTLGRD